jgi:hypothetical protein
VAHLTVSMAPQFYDIYPVAPQKYNMAPVENHWPKAHTLLEDICDKPIVIQSYCAVARLHGV